MNNTTLQKVLNEKSNSRQSANTIAEENLLKCMQNKNFSELEYKIRSLTFNIAQKQINNEDTASLQNEYDNLVKQQDALIKKLGYSRSDFSPKYSCKKCNDTGHKDGKLCECVISRYNELQKQASSLSNLIEYRFKDFNPNIYPDKATRDNMTKLNVACKRFTETFPNTNKHNLVFTGPIGVGKTYLISAIANELIDRDFFVKYVTAFELNQIFLKYHLADVKEKNDILEPILSCDILVVDDLGTEPIINKVTKEYLFLILNERGVQQKHIIVSTNLSPSDLIDRYGERVFSRLFNKRLTQVIGIDNIDLRIK